MIQQETTVALQLEGIRKSFGELLVLQNISLTLSAGETVSILGPSGCGKSTLLNIACGLTEPDWGRVLHNPEGPPPPAISYMMQESLLLPWRSLWKNALLGAEVAGLDLKIASAACAELFAELGLEGERTLLPNESSGGMVRRIALIRALIAEPRVLLLDEPFTNLDYDIKIQAQRLLLRQQKSSGLSILLVTHDIEDAIVLSDRILVLAEKPTHVKKEFVLSDSLVRQDPLQARAAESFGKHFSEILAELRYLDEPST